MDGRKEQLRRGGQTHREQAARRSRERTAAVAAVTDIPKVKSPARKAACRNDLHKFLTSYFPNSTGLKPFGEAQRKMIARMQAAVIRGGKLLNVLPRGFVKTTISELTALWAVLYGHRKFVAIYSAGQKPADEIIESLKLELAENDLLYEDFPEVCHPIRALEWKPQRCAQQTYRGKFTHIDWTADTVVLPTIPRSRASGAILTSKGISTASRGSRHKRPDGTVQRPDLSIVDDPQTDESAKSKEMTRNILNILTKGLGRSGGHARGAAIVVNATAILPGDLVAQLADPRKNPSWQYERVQMVERFSDHHQDFWLGEYARIRNTFDRRDPESQREARRNSTEFYRKNRKEMDRGTKVSWEHCYAEDDGEISAVQHAYNILIDDGKEVFDSECQNDPQEERSPKAVLTASIVANKLSGLDRCVVPQACQWVTAYCDVHERVLYWLVAAWETHFAGAVIDYGTYPKQPTAYFAQQSAPVAMAHVHRGVVEDAWLVAGMQAVADELLSRTFRREDGAGMKVGKLLYDARWGEKNKLVKAFCRRHKDYPTIVFPAQGIGIGASSKPFDEYRPEAGAQVGMNWRIGPAQDGDRWTTIDTNWWKTFAAGRLAMAKGTPGGWEIFGRDSREHELFADHCVAEEPIEVTAKGRTVDEWKMKPGRPDNHWWDCLCGAAVAGSMLGASVPERATAAKARRRVSLRDLTQRRT